MKKILICAIMLASIASFSSCSKSVLTKNAPVYSLTNSQVSNGYLETDLDIIGKVTGDVSGKFKRWGNGISSNSLKYIDDNNSGSMRGSKVEKAKAYALYETTKKAGCDIILAPIYTVEINKAFLSKDKFTVKVSGVGANIKGVKQKEVDPNK